MSLIYLKKINPNLYSSITITWSLYFIVKYFLEIFREFLK